MFAQPRIRKSALVPPPKKRKTAHTIEEITFDKDARAEYLTGFHKRKQARIKHAQEVAEQRARQERIEMRKQVWKSRWCGISSLLTRWVQIREERKQAVEEHVQAINQILREAEHAGTGERNGNSSDEEWGGLSDTEVPEAPIDVEEEYIDEDKYTTVTVEAVSVDRDGLHKPELNQPSEDEGSAQGDGGAEQDQEEKGNGGKRPKDPKKTKKKKFRYENKFERDVEARKQRAKRKKR
jgi:ribosomal RNA-processing protein 17